MNQYLSFHVAGEEYAVSILKVTEIIEGVTLTHVPGTPSWIRGVLNLRGAVVPVVDLAVKFGLAPTVLTRRTCVVIVELEHDNGRLVLGMMADSVHHVVEHRSDQIQPPPSFGRKVRVDCIEGMCENSGASVVLLDIDRVLSSSEILAASLVDETAIAS
ncbi:MAG TPA: chemotaxis protein CheW [Thermoanaerobaculia bacterium]|jgi:purine-binding chemotaxis protein CheW|nr:chemotaxis protein CheW [Thermoanaerobaculia bacterium]